MFCGCSFLDKLPDISKCNVKKVKSMSSMFRRCISLVYLPDIFKWDVTKVINMCEIYEYGISLSALPYGNGKYIKNVGFSLFYF